MLKHIADMKLKKLFSKEGVTWSVRPKATTKIVGDLIIIYKNNGSHVELKSLENNHTHKRTKKGKKTIDS